MAETIWDYALVTLAQVKEFVLNDSTVATFDDALTAMVNEVSHAIETYCGRKFKERTGLTEYHNPKGGTVVSLKNFPVTGTTAFALYDDPNRNYGSDTLIAATDYFLDLETGVIHLTNDGEFSSAPGAVKAFYSAGYATDSIPYTLQRACKKWVARIWKERVNQAWDLKSLGAAGETTSFDLDAMPKDVKKLLNMFKRVRV